MQPFGDHHMRLDQRQQRLHQLGHRADLIGKRGQAQRHAFSGIVFRVTVQWLMLAVFFEHGEPLCRHVFETNGERQQAGAGPTAGDWVERCRGLADLLAIPAGELLADGLNYLPLPGDFAPVRRRRLTV